MGHLLASLALCLATLAAPAHAACRQALALGLDVSGSVDGGEYGLQLRGLANALRNAEVRQALLSNPAAPVALAVYEWSAPEFQNLILDWTAIDNAATLEAVSRSLESTARSDAPHVTGLGQAMLFGAALLTRRPGCWKHTLDISGDGRSNSGPLPQVVRDSLAGQALTINALVIGADVLNGGDIRQVQIGELAAYFGANVILGADSFVETALGFEDYEAAMTRKLLREIEGLAVSDADRHLEARPVSARFLAASIAGGVARHARRRAGPAEFAGTPGRGQP